MLSTLQMYMKSTNQQKLFETILCILYITTVKHVGMYMYVYTH